MGGACSTYREQEICIQDFGGEKWGKRSFGRPKRRREYNIKMDLRNSWMEERGMYWSVSG
jgi:hypothetical protein